MNDVPLYDLFETALTGSKGYANPFLDVWVAAKFTAPSGRTLRAFGFYDGGDIWRIRLVPDEIGAWQYATEASDSADNGLHGRSGAFVCVPSGNKGFIRPDPQHPYYFSTSDGTPFFALGDTCGVTSAALSDANRATYLNARAGKPFNFLRMFASLTFNAWTGEPWSDGVRRNPEFFPWGGLPFEPDYDRLNPLYFRRYERILGELKSRGVHAEIVVFNLYEKPFKEPEIWTPRREALWGRYVVSRLCADTTVFLWTVAQEYERYPDGQYRYDLADDAWARRMATLIRETDPHRHPVSVHPWGHLPGKEYETALEEGEIGRRFGNSPEMDVLTHQHNSYDTATYLDAYELRYWDGPASGVEQAIWADRKYGKPVINAEYGYEWLADYAADFNRQRHGTDKCRRTAWRIFTAGGAGLAAGFAGTTMSVDNAEMYHDGTRKDAPFRVADMGHVGQLRYLYDFVTRRTRFWEMEPAQDLVNEPNLCLSNGGMEYVVYAPSGGLVALNLAEALGSFSAEWFNPRMGESQALSDVDGGAEAVFQTPDESDWVLHLILR